MLTYIAFNFIDGAYSGPNSEIKVDTYKVSQFKI